MSGDDSFHEEKWTDVKIEMIERRVSGCVLLIT